MNYADDYYAILGINKNATTEQIKTAYRLMCKVHHPDAGGDGEMMKLVNTAYTTLSDAKSREEYDRTYTSSSLYSDCHSSQPSNDITANVLKSDGNIYKRKFERANFKFKLDKYTDKNEEIYVYQNSDGKLTILLPYVWLHRAEYFNKPDTIVHCYAFTPAHKYPHTAKDFTINEIPFSIIDYITPANELYFIVYEDGNVKYFHTRTEWDAECLKIKERIEASRKRLKRAALIISLLIIVPLLFNFFNNDQQSTINEASNYTTASLSPPQLSLEHGAPMSALNELDYLIHENITFDEIISTYGKPFDWEYADDYSGYYTITYSDLEFIVYNSDDLTSQYVGYIHLPQNNTTHSICGFYVGQPIKELTNSMGDLHIYTDYEYTDNIWDDNIITYQIGDYDCYIDIAVDETKIIDIKYYIPV